MTRACSILVALLLVVGCADDDTPEPGWAIVKVEIAEGPTLASICIDAICEEFDPDAAVRNGEFSAFVQAGAAFEVLRVGESAGEGASGGSPVGGCMLVRLESDAADFIGGCDVAPPDR